MSISVRSFGSCSLLWPDFRHSWLFVWALWISLIATFQSACLCSSAAEPIGSLHASVDDLDSLTDRVLAKEIELERLNTEFRFYTTYVSPWRQRRVFLYQQANGWLTEVSQIEQMCNRYRLQRKRPPKRGTRATDTEGEFYEEQPTPEEEAVEEILDDDDADTPMPVAPVASNNAPAVSSPAAGGASAAAPAPAKKPPTIRQQRTSTRGKLANAAATQLIGGSIAAAGDVFEISLNVFNTVKLHRRNLTPGLYRRRVRQLRAELDALISERNQIIAKLPSDADAWKPTIAAETKIITDLRDLTLFEYREFLAATKRFWMLQNTAYFVDLAKNASSMTGNIVGLQGNARKKPRMAGTCGVLSIVSGAIVVLTPAFGRVTGNLSGLAARRTVNRELADIEVSDVHILQSDTDDLARTIASVSSGPDASSAAVLSRSAQRRLTIYKRSIQLLQEIASSQESDRKKGLATLKENILFAGLVGPPRIANGITQILGGWQYYANPPRANRLYAAGATAYAAGTGVNLLETTRLQVKFEANRHRQVREHRTPRDQFQKRMQLLDIQGKVGKED